MGREVGVAHVDVGRFHGDLYLAAFVDVLHHVVGVAHLRGQQRRHELNRIMGLKISRLVGQQRVSGGVRFVEAVAGELLHQVEDLDNLLFREAALHCAFDEALALRRHLFSDLLAHGAPQ